MRIARKPAGKLSMEQPEQQLTTTEVLIPSGGKRLSGLLTIPPAAPAIVAFAHGSGSSRLSPRNEMVAARLTDHGLATLLFDLLTPEEEEFDLYTSSLRFDIQLLATRLLSATAWLMQTDQTRSMRIGYFGASTGAAAALMAAAELPRSVQAIVSRGGRPDLAGEALPVVQAATLLIVGEKDTTVIDLNKQAQARMQCLRRIEIVPAASHLFEEPGALDIVSDLSVAWFTKYLMWPEHRQSHTAS
jgi:dienelactone hydrolase